MATANRPVQTEVAERHRRLCAHESSEEFRLAEIAQRYAVPVLEDLIAASRSEQVQDMFAQLRTQATAESVSSVFERYIYDAIRKYPTLNHPTQLDFGSPRIIVLNLQEVAPRGSSAAERRRR
jgi:intracellular multiplication protein IcmB